MKKKLLSKYMWKFILPSLVLVAVFPTLLELGISSNQSNVYVENKLVLKDKILSLSSYSLVNGRGQPIASLLPAGEAFILFFGYTHCPDVCPTSLGLLKRVIGNWRDQEDAPLSVVFVSVDPDRDLGENLQAYAEYFDPKFIGVSAPSDQLLRLAETFSTSFVRQETDPRLFSHSNSFYVISGQNRLIAEIQNPTNLKSIIEGLAKIL